MQRSLRAVKRPLRVKVSVVVPAYNSDPAGLQRLMASLDGQSMSPRHFEIVFVDDGSADDTRSRLDRIARTRGNVVVRSIPNSGWASRPRNVGTQLARGEYVLFMDHDDELFPQTLERCYVFAREHRADVVNPKEVRTAGWSWGWESFDEDVPHAQTYDPNPLLPMTPHKLYRRRFLKAHRIAFPEDRRVLWEDIYFNVQVYAHAPRVAVLSRYPCYHWVRTGANNSGTFGQSAQEFWSKLATLLEFIERTLADVPGAGEALVAHHLRARVLAFVGPRSLTRDEDYYRTSLRYVEQLLERHAGPMLLASLRPVEWARYELVQQHREDLLRELAQADRGVTAVPTLQETHWDGGVLVLTVNTTLVDGQGDPIMLRRQGERWLRDLPGPLQQALSEQALDVTASLRAATFVVSVKGRASRSTWRLPTQARVVCTEDGSGRGLVSATANARFDPSAFAAEHDLSDLVWDFAARFDVLGYTFHRGVRGGSTSVALLDGHAAVVYDNNDGLLSLDMAHAVRTVVGSARPPLEHVTLTTAAVGEDVRVRFRAALPAVHCHGETQLAGDALLGEHVRVPATLVAGAAHDTAGAELSFEATLAPGEHPVRARFLGRTGNTGLVLAVQDGTAAVLLASG